MHDAPSIGSIIDALVFDHRVAGRCRPEFVLFKELGRAFCILQCVMHEGYIAHSRRAPRGGAAGSFGVLEEHANMCKREKTERES